MRRKRFIREVVMLRWSKQVISIVITLSISGALWANDYLWMDDDLLCSGGNAQERLQQRIQQNAYQQRAMFVENQRAMAYQAAAEQKSLEMSKMARRARFEKEARKREAAIAKRKGENAFKNVSPSASLQTASKTLNQSK